MPDEKRNNKNTEESWMQVKMREKKHRAGTMEDIEHRIDLNSGFQWPSMGASVGSQDGSGLAAQRDQRRPLP